MSLFGNQLFLIHDKSPQTMTDERDSLVTASKTNGSLFLNIDSVQNKRGGTDPKWTLPPKTANQDLIAGM